MATRVRKRKAKEGFAESRDSTSQEEKSWSSTTLLAPPISPAASDMAAFLRGQPVWISFAIASGACAAINGVFAKLTTTSLTSSFSEHLSALLGLGPDANSVVNVVLRGTFFGLNLLFNAIMWGLFTAALAKGSSTTRVSIVNVSANFFVTAILGWLIFSEKLPFLWWVGAALLACGNVIIGRREGAEQQSETGEAGRTVPGEYRDDEEGVQIVLQDTSEHGIDSRQDEAKRVQQAEDIDAPI